MRTLRVTTTCSACLQAPDSYPAKLEKHHPMLSVQILLSLASCQGGPRCLAQAPCYPEIFILFLAASA